MTSLSSIASNLHIQTYAVSKATTAAVDENATTAVAGADPSATTQVAAPAGGTAPAGGGSGSSESSSGSSDILTQLQQRLAKLQKELAKEQQALQAAISAKVSPEEKATAVASAQAQVAATSGELQTVSAQLLEALSKQGSSTSGTSISTTA